MKFNENLKYLRKEANLTQEQFAEKLNVSRQAVTKWESGQSYPDIQNLKEMADMFNVTMDALVGDIGSKKERVINKKINDVGYFIFAMIILLAISISSISESIGFITGNEDGKIISYIILGIVGFLLTIYLLKKYLRSTDQQIVNMKNNEQAKKERKKYILNKYKLSYIGDIFLAIIINLPHLNDGIQEFCIEFCKIIVLFAVLTIAVTVRSYIRLEKKVKELNKD